MQRSAYDYPFQAGLHRVYVSYLCPTHTLISWCRYPREQYAVGAHAVLGLMYDALPAPLRLCVRSVALHLPRC